MLTLTKDQRKALKQVYDRGEIWPKHAMRDVFTGRIMGGVKPLTYRQFRKTVEPGPGCIIVPWKGMWLGIETDGYTHS